MKKTVLAAAMTIAMGTGVSMAAPTAVNGTFNMRSPGGGLVGSFSDVTGTFDSTALTWSVASPSPFFGVNWTAHDGVLLGAGTYTIPTVEGGTYTNFVVGAGEIGGHILFDYGPTLNIDVLVVWDDGAGVAKDPDGDGTLGTPMLDGAFPGWNASFNLRPGPTIFVEPPEPPEPIPVPAAIWLFGSGLVGLIGIARRKKQA